MWRQKFSRDLQTFQAKHVLDTLVLAAQEGDFTEEGVSEDDAGSTCAGVPWKE